MGAYKRIQLNILLTRYDSLSELKHIPEDTYLPVYYAAEEGVITKSLADQFKSEVFMARDGIDWGVVAVIIVAGEERGRGDRDGNGRGVRACHPAGIDPLPTNDAYMHHEPHRNLCGFNTRR